MKIVQRIKKACVTAILAFLVFSAILASVPIANAAGAIMLASTVRASGASVTVSGTGFGANQAVGIGFGAEVKVINETISITVHSGTGPHTGYVSHLPIKPGTFTDAANQSSTLWMIVGRDAGNGTVTGPPIFVNSTINYVTGQYTRFTTTPPTAYYQHLINYTYYQYNVTPAAGVTAGPSGAFSASITVPSVSDGVYNVTAVDTQGHTATATFTVANIDNV